MSDSDKRNLLVRFTRDELVAALAAVELTLQDVSSPDNVARCEAAMTALKNFEIEIEKETEH